MLRAHAVTGNAFAAVVALIALVALSCGGPPVRSQDRAPDCHINVLPNPPGPDYVEIGQLSFPPYIAAHDQDQYKSPLALAADLQPNICALGGDTLVTERNAAGVIVAGTVYRHAEVRDYASPPAPPPRAEGCEPACGAGFLCAAGTCVRQCTPACSEGEFCAVDGVCRASE
jgi:hypothetical protein